MLGFLIDNIPVKFGGCVFNLLLTLRIVNHCLLNISKRIKRSLYIFSINYFHFLNVNMMSYHRTYMIPC